MSFILYLTAFLALVVVLVTPVDVMSVFIRVNIDVIFCYHCSLFQAFR